MIAIPSRTSSGVALHGGTTWVRLKCTNGHSPSFLHSAAKSAIGCGLPRLAVRDVDRQVGDGLVKRAPLQRQHQLILHSDRLFWSRQTTVHGVNASYSSGMYRRGIKMIFPWVGYSRQVGSAWATGYRLRWSALNGNSHHRGLLHCMRRCKLS